MKTTNESQKNRSYLVDFLQIPPAAQISAGVSEYPKIALAIPAQYLSTPSAQAWGVASTSQTKVLRMTISLAISSGVVRYVPNLATPALQVSQSIWFKSKSFWVKNNYVYFQYFSYKYVLFIYEIKNVLEFLLELLKFNNSLRYFKLIQ